jgi:hypothetical protein
VVIEVDVYVVVDADHLIK